MEGGQTSLEPDHPGRTLDSESGHGDRAYLPILQRPRWRLDDRLAMDRLVNIIEDDYWSDAARWLRRCPLESAPSPNGDSRSSPGCLRSRYQRSVVDRLVVQLSSTRRLPGAAYPLDARRPDVAEKFRTPRSRESSFSVTIDLDHRFRFVLRAVLRQPSRRWWTSPGSAVAGGPLRSTSSRVLRPVMIDAPGRSATTALARLLVPIRGS